MMADSEYIRGPSEIGERVDFKVDEKSGEIMSYIENERDYSIAHVSGSSGKGLTITIQKTGEDQYNLYIASNDETGCIGSLELELIGDEFEGVFAQKNCDPKKRFDLS